MTLFEENQETINGAGEINFDYKSVQSHFQIKFKPLVTRIKIPSIPLGQLFVYNQGTLEGQLEDGRNISCSTISMSSYDKKEITFFL